MRVIEILNKISNGEEVPYKIRYLGEIYEYVEEMKWYLRDDMKCELSNSKRCLNDGVEILEEPKGIPEKLEILPDSEHYSNEVLYGKINEILDYLKSKGE